MAHKHKHVDHDYIAARQERYIEAFRNGKEDEMMHFMDPLEFVYSVSAGQQESMKHEQVKERYRQVFTDLYDLEIKTLSLHGHKYFTVWEWEAICKPAIGQTGEKLSREEAQLKKLIGCTLMWWNNNDKVVKNHEYAQFNSA